MMLFQLQSQDTIELVGSIVQEVHQTITTFLTYDPHSPPRTGLPAAVQQMEGNVKALNDLIPSALAKQTDDLKTVLGELLATDRSGNNKTPSSNAVANALSSGDRTMTAPEAIFEGNCATRACRCCCHQGYNITTPIIFGSLLGNSTGRHTGIPYKRTSCNLRTCQRDNFVHETDIRYQYPAWLSDFVGIQFQHEIKASMELALRFVVRPPPRVFNLSNKLKGILRVESIFRPDSLVFDSYDSLEDMLRAGDISCRDIATIECTDVFRPFINLALEYNQFFCRHVSPTTRTFCAPLLHVSPAELVAAVEVSNEWGRLRA